MSVRGHEREQQERAVSPLGEKESVYCCGRHFSAVDSAKERLILQRRLQNVLRIQEDLRAVAERSDAAALYGLISEDGPSLSQIVVIMILNCFFCLSVCLFVCLFVCWQCWCPSRRGSCELLAIPTQWCGQSDGSWTCYPIQWNQLSRKTLSSSCGAWRRRW